MSRRDPETKHLSGRELRDYLRALREGGGERTSELSVDAFEDFGRGPGPRGRAGAGPSVGPDRALAYDHGPTHRVEHEGCGEAVARDPFAGERHVDVRPRAETRDELLVDAPKPARLRSLNGPSHLASESAPPRPRTRQLAPMATAFLAPGQPAVGRPLLGGSAVEEAETSAFVRPASLDVRPARLEVRSASLDDCPASSGDSYVASEPPPKERPKASSRLLHALSLPRERVIRGAIACVVGMGALVFVAVQGSADHPSQASVEDQAVTSGAGIEAQAPRSAGEPHTAHEAALAGHEAGMRSGEGAGRAGSSALAAYEGPAPSAPAEGGGRDQTSVALARVHARSAQIGRAHV